MVEPEIDLISKPSKFDFKRKFSRFASETLWKHSAIPHFLRFRLLWAIG